LKKQKVFKITLRGLFLRRENHARTRNTVQNLRDQQLKRICEEKEATEICVKDLEFLTMNRSENGFCGIMVIEKLRSAVAPKERSI